MRDNLTSGENFFFLVNYYFEFLTLKGYEGSSFNIRNRDEYWVTFYSHLKKKKVTIVEYRDSGVLDFYVDDNRIFRWKRRYLKDYLGINIKIQNISHLAKLIKDNKTLYDDLTG